MKKVFMSIVGIALFVAGYQLTRRQTQYTIEQSITTNGASYVATPVSTSASLKSSVAFRLVNPS